MTEKKIPTVSNLLEFHLPQFGIALKQFTPNDAESIFELINKNRNHLSQFGDITASKYLTINSVTDSITNPKNPQKLRFGIWDGKTLVGSINLTPDKNGGPKAEIGYYLGSGYTGKGYMQNAVSILVDYAFSNLGNTTLFGNIHPNNISSQRVLLKSGFTKTGVLENGDFVYTIHK